MPYYHCISHYSWHCLLRKSSEGLYTLIHGADDEEIIQDYLGKMLLAIFSMSVTYSLRRLDKPGMGMMKKLVSVCVLFVSSILQIGSKLYSFKYLFLLNIGADKSIVYIPFFLGHFLTVILIKLSTETRKRKEATQYDNSLDKLKDFSKKTTNLVLSAVSSIFFKVDVSLDEEKICPPKLKFLSEGLYHLISLISNLILVLLPSIVPQMFPSEVNLPPLGEALCWIFFPWIISLSLEVNIISTNCKESILLSILS